MRILHTSDWHLGKTLEGHDRHDEQVKFCDNLIDIVEENQVDLVLVAGDIYDSYNPPSSAETLFYRTIERLAKGGKRPVFIIAGNHDNPERLESVKPLVEGLGITILGYPKSQARRGSYRGFSIEEAQPSFTKLAIGGQKINIISLPYPSEKRLNDAFEEVGEINEMQETYTKRIGRIFKDLEDHYRDDEINIALSHIFVVGSAISDSERRIELGGSLLVEKTDLPARSQYTALGHIHKPQRISKEYRAFYSGSPIQYSKNERSSSKSVYLVDLEPGQEPDVNQVLLDNYRPICLFRAKNIDQAMAICEERSGHDIFAYFEIETKDSIDLEAIRKMKKLMKNIIEIKPILKGSQDLVKREIVDISKASISQYFLDFYREENGGMDPRQDLIDLFNKLISKEDVDYETN